MSLGGTQLRKAADAVSATIPCHLIIDCFFIAMMFVLSL